MPERKQTPKGKLAVTVWQYKGGVGKTTISLVLAEIAAQNGLNVLAVDLDEQRNLYETLKLTGSSFSTLNVVTYLDSSFADDNYDFYVIDTHPSKDETIKSALAFADIVLIPVFGDYNSVINLRSVFDFAVSAGVGAGQIAIVKNCMTPFKVSTETESMLDEQRYPSAGRLPGSNILIRNIATGLVWDKGMRDSQKEPFYKLYSKVWRAFEKMQNGNFFNIWSD